MLNNQTGSSKEVTRMTSGLLLFTGHENIRRQDEVRDAFRAGPLEVVKKIASAEESKETAGN